MDQLKQAAGWVRKIHFWLLCVLALAIGGVGWMIGTGALKDEFAANKSKIEGEFNSLRGDLEPPLYNAAWETGMDNLTTNLKKEVEASWQAAYAEQQKHLKYPTWLPADVHKQGLPLDVDIRGDVCDAYTMNLKDELQRLLDIVGAVNYKLREQPGSSVARSPMGRLASPRRPERIRWSDQDQQAVEKNFFWPQRPKSEIVRRAQEDLWIYENLLGAINNVNVLADGKSKNRSLADASVLEISSIMLGGLASQELRKVTITSRLELPTGFQRKAEDGLPREAPVNDSAPAPAANAPPVTPVPSATLTTPATDDTADLTLRYVNADGKQIAEAAARQNVFRLVPLYLKVVIDQRALPSLLSELASAPLPIEVRQLHLGDARAAEREANKASSQADDGLDRNFDVPLEIYGVVFLYNKPDTKLIEGIQPVEAAQQQPNTEGQPPRAGGGDN